VDVRDGEKRVILKRGAEPVAAAGGLVMARGTAPAGTTAADAAGNSAGGVAGNGEEPGLTAIKSPMVGTFYSAASPDAKPFVSVGSAVDEETDVCIIEAMKVFNNIKAECRGTIAKVLVSNGQTVEFGQILFQVRPD
jgi:acetyl-CoA carboxylase biotin carboxyl carrier protein